MPNVYIVLEANRVKNKEGGSIVEEYSKGLY